MLFGSSQTDFSVFQFAAKYGFIFVPHGQLRLCSKIIRIFLTHLQEEYRQIRIEIAESFRIKYVKRSKIDMFCTPTLAHSESEVGSSLNSNLLRAEGEALMQ